MGFPISLTRSKNIALYNRITLRHCNLSPTSSDTENDKSNDFNHALNLAIRWATLSFHLPRTGTRKSLHPRKRAKTCPAETRGLDDLASWRLTPSVFSNSWVPLSPSLCMLSDCHFYIFFLLRLIFDCDAPLLFAPDECWNTPRFVTALEERLTHFHVWGDVTEAHYRPLTRWNTGDGTLEINCSSFVGF